MYPPGLRCDTPTFGTLLKHWRQARRMSQLDVVSGSRDFVAPSELLSETGRPSPSRDMVLLLARCWRCHCAAVTNS